LEHLFIFFNNNHLSPAGHRLVAILAYNFLVKKGLVDFQESWELIDPHSLNMTKWIKSANKRIENYITTDNQSYKFKGLFYQVKGDYNSSKANLIKYLDREKNDFEAYFFLGKALFKLMEFEASLNFFQKSFEGHPLEVKRYRYAHDFTELYKGGWENYEKGNLEEALSFAKKLERLKGEWWAQGLFLNYLIYEKMGELNNAELYVKQALKLWPNNLKFKLLMSSLKFKQKQFREAINFGSQTLVSGRANLEALLIVGISHVALGNNKEARRFLSAYVQINPKNQFVQQALLVLK
jgi:tetratricopeptide (TPR) repeat protein